MRKLALEVLLEETRLRYDAEHARHDQLYTRVGLYLGVLAIYGNALLRFLDRPPAISELSIFPSFMAVILALCVSMAAAFFCCLKALVGPQRGPMFSPNPGVWAEREEELRRYVVERQAETGKPPLRPDELDEAVATELREDLATVLRSAADTNVESNAWRFGWLHRAGLLVAFGAVSLVVAAPFYALAVYLRPPNVDAKVQIVEPVAVRMDGLALQQPGPGDAQRGPPPSEIANQETRMSDDKKEQPSQQGQQPPTKVVRPPPPPPREIREGYVPDKKKT